MNDERFLKDWLSDTTESSTDPNAAADKVVVRLSDAPQRHRWLPRPPVRRPKPDEPNGRTRFMLSPAQSITAGALAFALGAAFLVSQPFGEQTELPPAADDAVPMQPAEVSGRFTSGVCTDGTSEAVDLVLQVRGGSCRPTIEWTDQRLTGDVTVARNKDIYADASGLYIQSWAISIENDAGTWRMRPNTEISFRGSGEQPPQVLVLDGDGAYEGLTAVLRQGEEGPYGYIIESGMPPAPDNASTTS